MSEKPPPVQVSPDQVQPPPPQFLIPAQLVSAPVGAIHKEMDAEEDDAGGEGGGAEATEDGEEDQGCPQELGCFIGIIAVIY